MDIAQRLFLAITVDEKKGLTALGSTRAVIGISLCDSVEKHGTSEYKAMARKLKAKYAKRIDWAKDFVFGTWEFIQD